MTQASRTEEAKLGAANLVQRGIAAARAGEREEARSLLTRATDQDPDNAQAWLELAGVVEDLQLKRTHLRRALQLKPFDEEARLGLERVEQKLGIASPDTQLAEEETLYCTWHPDRETLLRCARCGKPMCPECSRRHPVGLRCKECAVALRSPLYKVSVGDFVVAGLVGLVLSTIAAGVMTFIGGLWFLALFIGPAIGGFVADTMSRVVRNKRGRGMQVLAGVCIVLGAMIAGVLLLGFPAGAFRVFTNIGLLIYIVLGIGAAAARLN
ncbi:MAG: hypothetical protein A2Z04_01090 [Chloroflexi bacterium RBG_16_57_9]|nr:MAG: hypothetical protein A2Z04_01090 [Chloroflexi bacterium RBG_16_57_9]